jgi:hypothetical protein
VRRGRNEARKKPLFFEIKIMLSVAALNKEKRYDPQEQKFFGSFFQKRTAFFLVFSRSAQASFV